jgi:hypothetical protein
VERRLRARVRPEVLVGRREGGVVFRRVTCCVFRVA